MHNSKTEKELRKYGMTMAIAFAVIALLFWFKDHDGNWPILAGLSAFFLVSGMLIPGVLAPVEWLWMRIAHYMGTVVTFILLVLTFFVVITPMGLLMRLLRKDLLGLKLDSSMPSYWIAQEVDGPQSRPEKPF